MKNIGKFLCCFIVLFLTSCSAGSENYEEGIENLNIKNYIEAERCFEKAIESGYTKDDIKVIHTIVSEYNDAKECYDANEYEKAEEHIDKIPNAYSNYPISTDIKDLISQVETSVEINAQISKAQNYLDSGEYDNANGIILVIDTQHATKHQTEKIGGIKDQIKTKKENEHIKKINTSILKAQDLLDSGEYEEANEIILAIDTQHATESQLEEIETIKNDIKLKRKNEDEEVLDKIDELVSTYVYGLCEAVNTGDFRPLKGCLYENSSIYKEQKSYIAGMAKKDIYEYVLEYKINSVEWETETTCVISTSEKYRIYDGEKYRTQTFRYTYDIIETKDKQLFLTTIKDSN